MVHYKIGDMAEETTEKMNKYVQEVLQNRNMGTQQWIQTCTL